MTGANPFPGLRAFDEDDAEYFFGRESEVDELLVRLSGSRFLAVTGASGCGKTSLTRAGLLPALRGGLLPTAGSQWRVAFMRPGASPVGALAAALESALGSHGAEQTLRRSSLGLAETIRHARLPVAENVLVLVDQFEELFRRRDSRDDTIAFVRLLMEGVRQTSSPIYVVITLRSEFFAQCAELQGLPHKLNQGVYLVPHMKRDQLRTAIEGPVGVVGAAATPALVQRVLNDLYEHPDYLPVLQVAMRRTWEYWQRDVRRDSLGAAAYESIGGPEALPRWAEELFGRLGPPEQEITKRVFQRLTEITADHTILRAPATMGELCEIANATLEQVAAALHGFREAALLAPEASFPAEPLLVCDLTHESLMRQWLRLRTWIDEEAQSAATYRRLADVVRRHHAGEASLLRGPDLKSAQAWLNRARPTEEWSRRYGGGLGDVVALIAHSRKGRWRLWN